MPTPLLRRQRRAPQFFVAALLLIGLSCSPPPPPATPPASPPAAVLSWGTLKEGDAAHGFSASALYVDDSGRPRGGRFIHTRTGFVLDLLAIESAPQAMVYVGTYPTSDDGEPHTQEHLLLGKGNKGRMLGNMDHVTLTEWSAFTAQFRTAYHFRTNAGTKAFFPVFETQLDALLHPDYTDEDIRREVRDFEVTRGEGGKRALTEKGTVYNEMVRTFDNADERGSYEIGRMIYGEAHPLAFEAGGTPAGIRKLLPDDIRRFHTAHYTLGNMGAVVALPSTLPLDAALSSLDAIFGRVGPTLGASPKPITESDLPPRKGAPEGVLRIVPYPYVTADHPSPAMFAWPPIAAPHLADRVLLRAFLDALGGGAGSVLYGALVDEKTRRLETGATGIDVSASDELGDPVASIQVDGVRGGMANDRVLGSMRDIVTAEIARVAALPDGSKELAAFEAKVEARLLRRRRDLDKALDTPPEFGTRGTYDAWIIRLALLGREPGFRKSVTFKEAMDSALAAVHASENPFRARIAAWGLGRAPYGVATQPQPQLRRSEDAERVAREAAESDRLVAAYHSKSADEALEKREGEIETATTEIARAEASVPMPPLTSEPPLTDDDLIAYKVEPHAGVPVVASTFDTMKSATVGLVLSVADVPDDLLPYLPVLPALVRRVGIFKDGVAIPYDVVDDRVRREVLGVGVHLSVSFFSKRAEIELTAAGNDPTETVKALAWLSDFLFHADLRPDNLPRIRDVVHERAVELANTTSFAEEHWVKTAARSYFRQDSRVLLHAGSFLTQAYDARRIAWRLEGGVADKKLADFWSGVGKAAKPMGAGELGSWLRVMGRAGHPDAFGREMNPPRAPAIVKSALSFHDPEAAAVLRAVHDLEPIVATSPDKGAGGDFQSMCDELARGSVTPPGETLSAISRLVGMLRHKDRARVWMVGSTSHQNAVMPTLDALLASLDPAPTPAARHDSRPLALTRAKGRGVDVSDPSFVALVDRSLSRASMSNTVPTAGLDETREDALVDFLAADVFNGAGAHSFYKRIWGAGLAYSGYANAHARNARFELYTDRCADLGELVRFTDKEARHAPAADGLVDYAIANELWSRGGETYESRAQGIATDLVEGASPDVVRAFRTRLLALRSRPDIAEKVHARVLPVYAQIIPTLPGAHTVAGGVMFATGPEPLLAGYEKVLREARGGTTTLLRLYPRDFWDIQ